jgi:hypothetical protein
MQGGLDFFKDGRRAAFLLGEKFRTTSVPKSKLTKFDQIYRSFSMNNAYKFIQKSNLTKFDRIYR